MNHDLKISIDDYVRITDGSKTFLHNQEKQDIQKGDTATLHEFDPTMVSPIDDDIPKGYTESKPIEIKITYVETLGKGSILAFSKATRKAKK